MNILLAQVADAVENPPKLPDVADLIIIVCAVIAGVAIGVVVYLLPTIFAFYRKHPQIVPIAVINGFFGWTLLGWVLMLAWSLAAIRTEKHPGGAWEWSPASVRDARNPGSDWETETKSGEANHSQHQQEVGPAHEGLADYEINDRTQESDHSAAASIDPAPQLHIRRGVKTVGPFPPQRIKQLIVEGKIKSSDLLRLDEDNNWTPASEVPGLANSFRDAAE
jgi:hypothetical protein